jgi:hypothetical protein
MNDDLALMLHERFANAAEEIHPANDLLVGVGRRYTRRRAGSKVALLAGAIALVAAAVIAPGLVTGSSQRQIDAAGASPSTQVTVTLYGHEFTLPTGFSVTQEPAKTIPKPIPDGPNRWIYTAALPAVASKDAASQVMMSIFDYGTRRGSDQPRFFDKQTPTYHVTIAGRDAMVGVFTQVPFPTKCPSAGCDLTPVPYFTIDILIAPRIHLWVFTSGISKAQAVAIVASGFK